MSTGNEFYDTLGDQFKSLADRIGALEKITNGELIVMPDGTTYTVQDLGLPDVAIRIYVQATTPTGQNSSTDVGNTWTRTTDGTEWFWDGLDWRSKATGDKWVGGYGLDALAAGVLSRGLNNIDVTSSATAPATPTYGDTWRDTANANAIKRWNGTTWVTITDNNIIADVNSVLNFSGADISDGGIVVFYQAAAPAARNATTHRGDLWYDTDDGLKRYRWDGTDWNVAPTASKPGNTDGQPPGSSPAVTLTALGLDALQAKWTPITNADPVTYEVHVSDAAIPVVPDSSTFYGITQGNIVTINRLPNGTSLVAGTTYRCRVRAYDADGYAFAAGTEGTAQVVGGNVSARLDAIEAVNTQQGTDIVNLQNFDAGVFPITTTDIQDNAITSPKIQANAVQATHVAAKSISSRQLIVSDYQNLAVGSDFEVSNAIPWDLTNARFTRVTTQFYSGAASLQCASGAGTATSILNATIPAKETDTYRIIVQARKNSTYNGSTNAKIKFAFDNGTEIGSLSLANSTFTASDAWERKTTTVAVPAVPAGVVNLQVSINADNTAGTLWLDDIFIQRMAGGELIVDGSITTQKVAADFVYSGLVSAEQIVAGNLEATLGVLGGLIVGTGISITPEDGIVIQTPLGDTQFPSDGSDITLTANVIANSLIILGSLSLRGTDNEISKGATLSLSTGVVPPKTAPTVAVYYPTQSTHTGFANRGLVWHSTQTRWLTTESLNSGVISQLYDDGTTEYAYAFENFSMNTDGGRPEIINAKGGICLVGNTAYTLCQTNELWPDTGRGRWYIYVWNYNPSWTSNANRWTYVRRNAYLAPGTSYVLSSRSPYDPTIGTDGTNLYVVQAAGNNYAHWIHAYSPTTGAMVGSDPLLLTQTNGTNFAAARHCVGLLVGAYDFGATKFVVAHENYPWAYVFMTTGTTQRQRDPNYEWGLSSTPVAGLAWHPSGPRFLSRGPSSVTAYSKIKDTDLATNAVNIAYTWRRRNGLTWYTSDAETTLSPRLKTTTFTRRAWMKITVPPIPNDTGDPNDADSFGPYIARGTTPTNSSYRFVQVLPGTWNDNFIYVDELPTTGAAPPTATYGFTAGAPAALVSDTTDASGAVQKIAGDGSGRNGELTTDSNGKSSLRVPHIRRTLTTATSPASATYTKVPFNSTKDNYEITSPTAGDFTVQRNGIYTISTVVNFDNNSTAGYRGAALYVSGANVFMDRRSTTVGFTSVGFTIDYYLASGTTVSIYAWQNSGAALPLVNTGDECQLSITYKGTK